MLFLQANDRSLEPESFLKFDTTLLHTGCAEKIWDPKDFLLNKPGIYEVSFKATIKTKKATDVSFKLVLIKNEGPVYGSLIETYLSGLDDTTTCSFSIPVVVETPSKISIKNISDNDVFIKEATLFIKRIS